MGVHTEVPHKIYPVIKLLRTGTTLDLSQTERHWQSGEVFGNSGTRFLLTETQTAHGALTTSNHKRIRELTSWVALAPTTRDQSGSNLMPSWTTRSPDSSTRSFNPFR